MQNSKSYPIPVLGNRDDFTVGDYSVSLNVEITKESIVLKIVNKLEGVQELQDLIATGQASFVAEAQCNSVFYREAFLSKDKEVTIRIPATRVRDQLGLEFFVCSSVAAEQYRSKNFHPQYGGAKFSIRDGDMLAFGGSALVVIDKEFIPRTASADSIMEVTWNPGLEDGPSVVEYAWPKIRIVLSKNDWEAYQIVKRERHAANIIHASLVLPVLADAIVQRADFGERVWSTRLSQMLLARKLSGEEPLADAQALLENPLSRHFTAIKTLLDTGENET